MIKWIKRFFNNKPVIELSEGRKVKPVDFMVLPIGTYFRIVDQPICYRMDDFHMWDMSGLGDMVFSVEVTDVNNGKEKSMVIAHKMPVVLGASMYVPIKSIRILS